MDLCGQWIRHGYNKSEGCDQWLVEEVTDQAMVREGGDCALRGWGFRMLQNLKGHWCRNHW